MTRMTGKNGIWHARIMMEVRTRRRRSFLDVMEGNINDEDMLASRGISHFRKDELVIFSSPEPLEGMRHSRVQVWIWFCLDFK